MPVSYNVRLVQQDKPNLIVVWLTTAKLAHNLVLRKKRLKLIKQIIPFSVLKGDYPSTI